MGIYAIGNGKFNSEVGLEGRALGTPTILLCHIILTISKHCACLYDKHIIMYPLCAA